MQRAPPPRPLCVSRREEVRTAHHPKEVVRRERANKRGLVGLKNRAGQFAVGDDPEREPARSCLHDRFADRNDTLHERDRRIDHVAGEGGSLRRPVLRNRHVDSIYCCKQQFKLLCETGSNVDPRRPDPRALRLFAEHGFERTTIAAIEGEAGLAAGSGGLYRHFPSKRALLDSAIDWAQEDRSSFAMADDRLYSVDVPAEALRAVVELALEAARAGTDLSLVLMRVEESHESLDEDHRHGLIVAQYKRLAGWLELFALRGHLPRGRLRSHRRSHAQLARLVRIRGTPDWYDGRWNR